MSVAHQSAIPNNNFTTPKRRNTICTSCSTATTKASSSGVNGSGANQEAWWAVLTDGVWCLDDDTVILHVERDKFCAGPDGQDLASLAPEFAVELEASSPQLKVGKDGVVASRAVCALEARSHGILALANQTIWSSIENENLLKFRSQTSKTHQKMKTIDLNSPKNRFPTHLVIFYSKDPTCEPVTSQKWLSFVKLNTSKTLRWRAILRTYPGLMKRNLSLKK